MKTSTNILTALNGLLALELGSISQYVVHAKMCDNWGYSRLSEYIMRRAIMEMEHAEKLIARILFFGGTPVVNLPPTVQIGSTVEKMLAADHSAELVTIEEYNNAIALCSKERDEATREILSDILEDEDLHVDEIESRLAQIEQLGQELFLSVQVKEG